MPKSRQTLRQRKLQWCSEHNTEMQNFRGARVAYLVNQCPKMIESFDGRTSNAKDALNKYLGSDKASYWDTKPQFVAELCAALNLTPDIWQLEPFDDFVSNAERQYQQLGILDANTVARSISKKALMTSLDALPAKDGRDTISFLSEENKVLAFRKERTKSQWPKLTENEKMRLRISDCTQRHLVCFTVDPTDDCIIVTPSLDWPNNAHDEGTLFVPPLSEETFYPPEKPGWYRLYVLSTNETTPTVLTKSKNAESLRPDAVGLLIDHCRKTVESGSELRLVHFFVEC